jgi:hypothetical protein
MKGFRQPTRLPKLLLLSQAETPDDIHSGGGQILKVSPSMSLPLKASPVSDLNARKPWSKPTLQIAKMENATHGGAHAGLDLIFIGDGTISILTS